MINSTHTAAATRVIRVKRSPAREPKALEPPTPPKAPAKPPPLPRWIRTSRIKKRLTSSTRVLINVEYHGTSSRNTVNLPVLDRERRTKNEQTGIIRLVHGGEKMTSPVRTRKTRR